MSDFLALSSNAMGREKFHLTHRANQTWNVIKAARDYMRDLCEAPYQSSRFPRVARQRNYQSFNVRKLYTYSRLICILDEKTLENPSVFDLETLRISNKNNLRMKWEWYKQTEIWLFIISFFFIYALSHILKDSRT